MSSFRSHFISRFDLDPIRAVVRVWHEDESAGVPEYREVLLARSLDVEGFGFVSLECGSADALLGDNRAVRSLSDRLETLLEGAVRYVDSEDVCFHETAPPDRGSATASGSVYRSHWFRGDPERVQPIVQDWQMNRASQVQQYRRSWLVRGLSDPEVHGLSTQWATQDDLTSSAANELFGALFDEMGDIVGPSNDVYYLTSLGSATGR